MPPKKVPFRRTGRTGKEALEDPKTPKKMGSSKAGFVRKEIAKGNLKKEGGKIVDAKAKAKTPTPKEAATPKKNRVTIKSLLNLVENYQKKNKIKDRITKSQAEIFDKYENINRTTYEKDNKERQLKMNKALGAPFFVNGEMTFKTNKVMKNLTDALETLLGVKLFKYSLGNGTANAVVNRLSGLVTELNAPNQKSRINYDKALKEYPDTGEEDTPKKEEPKKVKAEAPLPSNAEVFKMKNKLVELANEEEELIETDGAAPEYLKALREMKEETPIYFSQQPRLMLAKAIKPTAKSTSKTLLKLYREAKRKGVIKGEVLEKWNEWKQKIANGYKKMRVDEIGYNLNIL